MLNCFVFLHAPKRIVTPNCTCAVIVFVRTYVVLFWIKLPLVRCWAAHARGWQCTYTCSIQLEKQFLSERQAKLTIKLVSNIINSADFPNALPKFYAIYVLCYAVWLRDDLPPRRVTTGRRFFGQSQLISFNLRKLELLGRSTLSAKFVNLGGSRNIGNQ